MNDSKNCNSTKPRGSYCKIEVRSRRHLMEDDQMRPSSSAPLARNTFNSDLDPSNLLGFLEKAFEFVAKETDMFNSHSLWEDVDAVVRKVKYKLKAEKTRDKESVEKEEIMEDQKRQRNTFNSDLDLSNPLGFLEKVFEFVAKKTDIFNSDSLLEDLNVVVRKVKDKESVEKKIEETVPSSEEIMEDMEEKVKEKDPQEPKKEDEPVDFLDIINLLNACAIYHPEYDFKAACFCEECHRKIKQLTDFEKEIKIKRMINQNHYSEVQKIKRTCSIDITFATNETKWMLYILHRKLGQLNEKSGVPMTPEKSRSTIDVCDKIFKILEDNDFNPKDEEDSFKKICEIIDKCELSDYINTAKYYYGRTNVKSSAISILKEMEKLEEKKKNLSNLTDHLEAQVELVRGLPVRGLQRETEDAIKKVCPLGTHTRMFLGARKCINMALEGMIRESVAFWKRYQKCPSHDHGSNGLDKTLDKLIKKAELFEDEWDSKYASFFKNPFNHPDPKKQRIV